MLRDEMVTEVRRRLGEDVADMWSTDDIIRNLDMAVITLAKEEPWPWLQTVGSESLGVGDATVVLPADVDLERAFSLRLKAGTTFYTPRRVTPVEGFNLETRYTTASQPRYFYIVSTSGSQVTLRFAPAADKTYVVDYLYLRRPASMVSANVEPDAPEDLHPAIVAWATAQLWLHELVGGDVKSGEQIALYMDAVDKARRALYRLNPDEELVWGRESDEEAQAGNPFGFRLPDNYGRMGEYW